MGKVLSPHGPVEPAVPPAPSLMQNPETPLAVSVTCAVLDTLPRGKVGYL